MKLFVYSMREFDEKEYFDKWCKELGVTYGYTQDYPSMENLEQVRGYDAVSFVPWSFGRDKIEKAYSLGIKYLAARSIGYDHIDLQAAHEFGMKVTNVSYPPNGVANYTIMLMLMCCRNMKQILERNIVQDFTLKGKIGIEISNCTVGIIGTGKIGSTVARHLSGFGCKILGYDKDEKEYLQDIVEYTELERLYEESDIITLHMPSYEETRHMINGESLEKMKDGVILINTARGDLIETDSLIAAIESRKIGAAALDVLENEDGLYYIDLKGIPIPNHDLAILKSFPNVILTPHTSFYTQEAVEHMVKNVIKACLYHGQDRENPFLIH